MTPIEGPDEPGPTDAQRELIARILDEARAIWDAEGAVTEEHVYGWLLAIEDQHAALLENSLNERAKARAMP
jgi:hypothetical protein